MRGKTRRQEIDGKHLREQITAIALIIATFVLLSSLCVSCVRSCGCGGGSRNEEQDVVSATTTNKDEVVLTTDDIAFLRSLTEYPRLVSEDCPLPTGYAPSSLMALTGMINGSRQQLHPDAGNAFFQLYDALMADGIALHPLSGYRTYEEQVNIFNYNLQLHIDEGMTPEEAHAYTKTRVAIPGTSEHQYGRSIDVTIDGTTDDDFYKTEQGQWLIDHAHEHGFIIRYPKEKSHITGIDYEPWHLRWVGKEHAAFISRHNICLEEYIQLIMQYNSGAVMCYD